MREQIVAALDLFVPVWDALSVTEQTRILRLLIERIEYDGVGQALEIRFHALGVKLLAREASEARAATA